MNRQGFVLSAMAGHAVDLYRLVRFDIRNPHSYSKFRQIKALARRAGCDILIETGTYVGNTAMRCSAVFDRVVTMELDHELYRKASRHLAKRKNVECLEGDALALLPAVLARPDVNKALIFLDGHFSGSTAQGDTAHGGIPEPACEEIEAIAKYRDKVNALIVDDFRCFGREQGWPRRSDLLKAVEQSFDAPEFDYAIHFDQLLLWRNSSA